VGEVETLTGFGEVALHRRRRCPEALLQAGQNPAIKVAKFMTFGCASAIASSSALTEMFKGRPSRGDEGT
jgi:NifU-like protein